ncbi:hypothetical protein JZ751_018355 [Albula glossodonta]|uniref:Transmembrane protein n=1 Tax=Albula glossodonta TaxID=121402 RepID=A0A8T2P095_9TELE|nr:hypothetical protein JZ751_018355 [Albula glossodonta]
MFSVGSTTPAPNPITSSQTPFQETGGSSVLVHKRPLNARESEREARCLFLWMECACGVGDWVRSLSVSLSPGPLLGTRRPLQLERHRALGRADSWSARRGGGRHTCFHPGFKYGLKSEGRGSEERGGGGEKKGDALKRTTDPGKKRQISVPPTGRTVFYSNILRGKSLASFFGSAFVFSSFFFLVLIRCVPLLTHITEEEGRINSLQATTQADSERERERERERGDIRRKRERKEQNAAPIGASVHATVLDHAAAAVTAPTTKGFLDEVQSVGEAGKEKDGASEATRQQETAARSGAFSLSLSLSKQQGLGVNYLLGSSRTEQKTGPEGEAERERERERKRESKKESKRQIWQEHERGSQIEKETLREREREAEGVRKRCCDTEMQTEEERRCPPKTHPQENAALNKEEDQNDIRTPRTP